MRFHELSRETLQNIAYQIETLLSAFTNDGRLGRTRLPDGLSLFESCREDILDFPEQWAETLRAQKSRHIEQWRRPQVTWYHQLRTTDRVFGFARSIELDGSEGGGHRVIEVVPSTVAEEFQKVIDSIDNDEPVENEAPASEPTAVLLHVPRYAFYGLATHTGEDAIDSIHPFFPDRLIPSERKMGRESLITLLEGLPSAFGAIIPTPPP